MIQGFVPDFSHAHNFVGSWYEGPPEKSFWGGTKAQINQGIPIGAFRCTNCGFLEFYAKSEFAARG